MRSENGIPPPGAVIARNRLAKDHRDEVQYGERVPFIVPEGYGAQSRLVDRAVEPLEFLEDECVDLVTVPSRAWLTLHTYRRHRIDAAYHIKHTIAALNRIFTLLGIDTREWASKMPKAYRVAESTGTAAPTASQFPSKGQTDLASVPTTRTTIDKFYRSDRCLSCDTALEDTSCGRSYCRPDRISDTDRCYLPQNCVPIALLTRHQLRSSSCIKQLTLSSGALTCKRSALRVQDILKRMLQNACPLPAPSCTPAR